MSRESRPYRLPAETTHEEYAEPPQVPANPLEEQAPPGNGWKWGLDPEKVGAPIAEQFRQTGDPQLVDQLIELYYQPLKRYAERMHFKSGGRNVLQIIDSIDVAHSAILKILNRVKECQDEGAALPLLRFRYFTYTVSMLYIDYHRRRQSRKVRPVAELPEAIWSGNGAPVDVAQLAVRSASQKHLKDVLDSVSDVLPDSYRKVAFDIWQGKSRSEVAAAHGLHESKVARIMRKVRVLIGPIVEEGEWVRELIADE